MTVWLVLFLALLIALSAFLSASETAFFSLSSPKVRAFRVGKDPRGRLVASLLDRPRDLLVTLLISNLLTSLLVQNVISGLFGGFSGLALSVGLPLILILIFGDVIPKSLALANNAKAVLIAVRPLVVLAKILGPVRKVLIPVAAFISRVCFFFLKYPSRSTLQELKHALNTSKNFGFLNSDEAKLLRGYLNMEEATVKEVMSPRGEIVAFELHEPIDKLIEMFADQECSRVPVYDGALENIIGIMQAITFFLHRQGMKQGTDLVRYLVPPLFFTETLVAKKALSALTQAEAEMAIVVDEYGSVSGLMTREDLIEVVIGSIVDKRDTTQHYTKASEDVVIANGKMELAEFEELFDVHLESPNNMATLGGWLTEKRGDIPKEGEKILTDHFLFHILAADATKVEKVYIRRLKK